MTHDIDGEVDANFEKFQQLLPELVKSHPGKFALMREREIHGFFASAAVAMAAGRSQFRDGLFSVQEVTDRPVDLGFFSHAVDTRSSNPPPTAG
jgi:hypothetical protein